MRECVKSRECVNVVNNVIERSKPLRIYDIHGSYGIYDIHGIHDIHGS